MKKKIKYNPTIGQNILFTTISIVMVVLVIASTIYFAVFSKRTSTLIESQSKEINKQIVLNYETYINSVIETANFIQFSSLSQDVVKNHQQLQDIFTFNSIIKKDVVSIYLFSMYGEKILGGDIKGIKPGDIRTERWFRESRIENSISHFSIPMSSSLSKNNEEDILFLSRALDYVEEGIKKKGILLIKLNFKTLTDLSEKTNLGEGGHILILDDEDSIIYLSNNFKNAEFYKSKQIAVKHFIGGVKAKINSTEYYINISSLIHTRWRIVTVNNVNDISLAREEMIFILIIILIVSLFMTAIVSIYISKRITRPLNKLNDRMFKLESGDFNTKVEVEGQKEVVRLANSFNSMIDEIKTLMDKVVEKQKDTRRNELRALQNQINPHFLYNTLDSIVWLAENQKTDDVITTVVALARFFRISISRGATTIPVKDEISHIENYLTIQKIRYVDKFKYLIEIAEDVEELKVMKLILQPLVENAIYHGIGEDMELITIKAYRDKVFLYFDIENSGYGITDERINEIYEILEGIHIKSSVGMKNVYQRIKLYYGHKADIKIKSILDEKTQVKIIIPIVDKENEHF